MTDSMSINTSMNVTGTPVSNTISTPPTQVPAVQTKTDKTAAVSSEDATKQPATSTLVTTDGNAEKAVSIHGDTLEISSQGMDKAKDMITAPSAAKASGMPTASSKPTASGTAPLSNASTAGSGSNSSALNLVTTVTEADDTESTADLSKYSDADLKKLVADGKISSVQYNQEMDRRKEANNTKDQGSSETADNQNFINNLQ